MRVIDEKPLDMFNQELSEGDSVVIALEHPTQRGRAYFQKCVIEKITAIMDMFGPEFNIVLKQCDSEQTHEYFDCSYMRIIKCPT